MIPGVKDIPLKHDLIISTAALRRANEESIRLGFSRNLEGIENLPENWRYLVVMAAIHTSMDGLQNIRLMILLPTKIGSVKEAANSLEPHFLDVTRDTWREILRRDRRWRRRNKRR
jgi:hypothetical protein